MDKPYASATIVFPATPTLSEIRRAVREHQQTSYTIYNGQIVETTRCEQHVSPLRYVIEKDGIRQLRLVEISYLNCKTDPAGAPFRRAPITKIEEHAKDVDHHLGREPGQQGAACGIWLVAPTRIADEHHRVEHAVECAVARSNPSMFRGRPYKAVCADYLRYGRQNPVSLLADFSISLSRATM